MRAALKKIPGLRQGVRYARRLYKDHFGAPDLRKILADTFLVGQGIEIGGLHLPLRIPSSASRSFVDRMTVSELRHHYPELADEPLVPVDIVDNGERLTTFANASQDFIIANHFLEHTEDPIGTIKRFMEVLRPGGVLYMAVPDKRYTFDLKRELTSIEHLFRDYNEGPGWSRESHYREWAEHVSLKTGDDLEAEARRLMDANYSIHFHVWDSTTLMQFLVALQRDLALPFAVEAAVLNGTETICILRRR